MYKAFINSNGANRLYDTIIDYNPSFNYYVEVHTIYYDLAGMLGLPELDYQE